MGDTTMDFDKDENITFDTSKGVKVVSTFDGMGIREDLLRGLYSYGFEKPSAIQQRAIVPITSGRDVIAQAQSGTGKTSMISLALCQMLDTNTREVQALVLSPTRELATQIGAEPGYRQWTHRFHCWLSRGDTLAAWAWLGAGSGAQPDASQGSSRAASRKTFTSSGPQSTPHRRTATPSCGTLWASLLTCVASEVVPSS